MIVTLAGHVDHGKTSLVEALTGTNTDRLAEERRRGLTIDLGFAYLDAGDTTVGFVDVPGHHRFIHNMVAGVAALQHALLVVAADDGPMPQTAEHLDILRLLGVSAGTVALTKLDRADPARLAAARAAIDRLTAGTFLAGAPVIETSTVTGQNVDTLRDRLLGAVRSDRAPADGRPFRLAIDRAFTLKGAGLVVTGTVHAGRVSVDDEVHLFPAGRAARVRDLRVQNRTARSASAGDRAALNLAGIDAGLPARGAWLTAAPDAGHDRVVMDLEVLADHPRPVRHWTPVHVYHATTHATGRLALLAGSRVAPGERARAELVLDAPLLARRGDRLIVRDHALERTLGGGVVIDNRGLPGRRRASDRLAAIDAVAAPDPEAALEATLALDGVDLDAFRRLWDLTPAALEELLAGRDATLRQGRLVSNERWRRWRDALAGETTDRHRDDPALQGLRENEYRTEVPATFRGALLAELVTAGVLEQRAGRFRPAQHRAALTAEEQSLLARLTPHLDQPQPPSLGDLGKRLRIPLAALQRGIKPLASKGELVVVSDKRVYLPRHVDELAEHARRLAAAGPFTAREFRDASGVGRNVAIDVLEYFDRRRFTRRQGDTRIVVSEGP